MSQIILSAKSGSDWTENELAALKITISALEPADFFGGPLPLPGVDPILLDNLERPAAQISKDNRLFFRYLEDASSRFPSGPPAESAVDDFAAFLLGMLDYDEPERVVHQRLEIGFVMCGQKVGANPDIVIMDAEDYILLVQQDKRHLSSDTAEPQLIAEAVAAYYANNSRRRAVGLEPVTSKVFAGIVLLGTAPIFYQIPISSELVTAIARAQHPQNPTIVKKLVPPVPHLHKYLRDGMVLLENRRIVFQCLTAFKQFVG
ncbi:hypothetical protein B0H15DRAFT_852732 [Mycena belliarum]|uniref:Uncharacterized protein n=1 Tax=Mycena belliarum TaxID=1033014 RepID=A0AAD6U297_9AGAR|nr:hypothetical protein B0H15DRAFT_852732 [Mycena belliae]